MDPDANLKEQRALAARMMQRQDDFDDTTITETGRLDYQMEQADDGTRLAELVQALDEWISRKGFLPAAWRP